MSRVSIKGRDDLPVQLCMVRVPVELDVRVHIGGSGELEEVVEVTGEVSRTELRVPAAQEVAQVAVAPMPKTRPAAATSPR